MAHAVKIPLLRKATMKSKTVILMVVAIACGLAASYMTSRVIADRDAKTEVEKVPVLVAKRNIGMGTLINDPEKFFEEKQFIKEEAPKKAIRNLDELKNQRLNKPLSAEQFVTADDLWDKEKDGLAGRMRKGYRAVGLNVSAERTSGGFVLPNSHVDIVSVITDPKGKTISKIILQNILVLAVDQLSNRPDDKSAVVANTVTVEVTPEQAQRLALAQKLGSINLILRAFDDDKQITTTMASSEGGTLDNSPDEQVAGEDTARPRTPVGLSKVPDVPLGPGVTAQLAEAKPAESRKVHIMTIINGEHVRQEPFQLDEKGDVVTPKVEKSRPDAEATPKTGPLPAAEKP
jgi:pilus assembly protein CpaB